MTNQNAHLRDVLATPARYAVGVVTNSETIERNGGKQMNPWSNHQAGVSQHREYEMNVMLAQRTAPAPKTPHRTLTGVLALVLRLFG